MIYYYRTLKNKFSNISFFSFTYWIIIPLVDQYESIIRQVAFKFPEHYYSHKIYDKIRSGEIADAFYNAYIRGK